MSPFEGRERERGEQRKRVNYALVWLLLLLLLFLFLPVHILTEPNHRTCRVAPTKKKKQFEILKKYRFKLLKSESQWPSNEACRHWSLINCMIIFVSLTLMFSSNLFISVWRTSTSESIRLLLACSSTSPTIWNQNNIHILTYTCRYSIQCIINLMCMHAGVIGPYNAHAFD